MRSRWLWPAPFALALLAVISASGFVFYRRAATVLEHELDARLLVLGRAAGPAPSSADLARLRAAGGLENLFVIDPADRSLADARPGVPAGQRYTALDYAGAGVVTARAGHEAVSPAFLVEGVPLRTAYVPLPEGRVLVLVASEDFEAPLRELARVPWVALALGLLAAALFALSLAAARRRLEDTAAASVRVERLALAGRLAAQVAHEIRNPLAIVRGAVQLAHRAVGGGKDPRAHLADALEETDRIDALVDDFLSLSRDVALEKRLDDLNTIAHRAAALAEVGTRRSIRRALAPAPLPVEADERRVRQALLALLSNAAEAAGPAAVEVRTGEAERGPWVEVVDEGPGMDPATLARAGEPFFTTKATGTGLGLSVVRQIAAAHGALLDVDSAPGRGTRIRLSFPAVPARTAAVRQRS